jgi:Kef-type K+ transport system membrane component KefB
MIDGVLGTVFLDLIVVLLVARIGGWLAEKIGQPSVLGELLVGLILGPSLLGLINPFAEGENIKMVFEILTFLGEIGIMLLLFQIGLESNI